MDSDMNHLTPEIPDVLGNLLSQPDQPGVQPIIEGIITWDHIEPLVGAQFAVYLLQTPDH